MKFDMNMAIICCCCCCICSICCMTFAIIKLDCDPVIMLKCCGCGVGCVAPLGCGGGGDAPIGGGCGAPLGACAAAMGGAELIIKRPNGSTNWEGLVACCVGCVVVEGGGAGGISPGVLLPNS